MGSSADVDFLGGLSIQAGVKPKSLGRIWMDMAFVLCKVAKQQVADVPASPKGVLRSQKTWVPRPTLGFAAGDVVVVAAVAVVVISVFEH